MTKSEYKYVLAWTHAQALHFARTMEWKRSEWRYVGPGDGGVERLKGMHTVILYEVRAPRYNATPIERDRMERILAEIAIMQNSGRIIKTNVVNLP